MQPGVPVGGDVRWIGGRGDVIDRWTLTVELSIDGNKWCALVGENLQEGAAGFGDGPMAALRALCDELAAEPQHLPFGERWR